MQHVITVRAEPEARSFEDYKLSACLIKTCAFQCLQMPGAAQDFLTAALSTYSDCPEDETSDWLQSHMRSRLCLLAQTC